MPISKPLMLVIGLVIAASALTAMTLATLNLNKNVSSLGTITTSPNLGVYSDIGCTVNMTTINWGSVAAGSSVNQTIYVKNTGTGTLTLGLSTSNWNPSTAISYLSISWNQQGTQLAAGQQATAVVTLTVSSNVTGITTFSNTISITGS